MIYFIKINYKRFNGFERCFAIFNILLYKISLLTRLRWFDWGKYSNSIVLNKSFHFICLYNLWTCIIQRRVHIIVFLQWNLFFFHLSYLSRTFMIHRAICKGEAISLTPLSRFHLLHIYLDISPVITAESSTLHIARNQAWNGNL